MTATALGHPLSTLRDGVTGLAGDQSRPIPLSAMRVEVAIGAGLAVVTTTRRFRNAASEPIEAVLTFPVAFDAVVTGLSAQVDERTLAATAQAKAAARDTYEGAVARGKLAVLHEEALKGVHVLSVGALGAGAEVAVTVETVTPLSFAGVTPVLRIPTTVGDLYGTSQLLPADDILAGPGALPEATLAASADAGRLVLDHHGPLAGEARVRLDRPIVMRLEGGEGGERGGRDAFGRAVRLSLQPLPSGDGALDCAVLFDRSGSTGGRAGDGGETVWAAMRRGLGEAAAALRPGDTVALWQFDSHCEHLGTGSGPAGVRPLLARIGDPAGGTELGAAIDNVAEAGVRDVVVLTDGQTFASEAHLAAARGCRVSAVLVGPGSLDAGVGHLAAMTGGTVAWAPDAEVGVVLRQALDGMRIPGAATTGSLAGRVPSRVEARRTGAVLTAAWDGPAKPEVAPDPALADTVGRYAAALALPLLDEEAAGVFAAAHGLCTHLTSLVLVDEAGQGQEGLPTMRKVPLAPPGALPAGAILCMAPSVAMHYEMLASPSEAFPRTAGRRSRPASASAPAPRRRPVAIDWATDGARIAGGDTSTLPADLVVRLRRLAVSPDVRALAKALGIDPLLAVLALLARRDESSDRHARRVAQRVLAGADPALVAAAELSLAFA